MRKVYQQKSKFARPKSDNQLHDGSDHDVMLPAPNFHLNATPPSSYMGHSAAQRKEADQQETPDLDASIADYNATVDENTSTADRLAKVDSIIEGARDKLTDIPTKVKALKHNNLLSIDEKTKILGKLIAAIGKMEYLLGKLYFKGQSNMERTYNKTKKRWDAASNSGVMVNHYKTQLGLSKSTTYAWCTMFLGNIQKVIGAENATSENFLSGLRMRDKTNINTSEGGKMTGLNSGYESSDKNNPWRKLKTDIEACKTDDDKTNTLNTFFSNNIMPQAGDSMVVKRSSANSNSFVSGGLSHSTLIEKVENNKIYTIEGNKGNNITGRVYDLKSPSDIGMIIYIKRFGFSHIDSKNEGDHRVGEPSTGLIGNTIQNIQELLMSINLSVEVDSVNQKLMALVDPTKNSSQSVYELDGNQSGGSDS